MTAINDNGHRIIEPPCARCGQPATRIELVPPGARPVRFDSWPESSKQVYADRCADPTRWHFLYEGLAAGNGLGNPIDSSELARYLAAFQEPFSFARVHTADFYDDAGFCERCDAAYCYDHWNPSSTELGTCPQGHKKSLDPFW